MIKYHPQHYTTVTISKYCSIFEISVQFYIALFCIQKCIHNMVEKHLLVTINARDIIIYVCVALFPNVRYQFTIYQNILP